MEPLAGQDTVRVFIFSTFRKTWRGLIAARGDAKYTEDIEKVEIRVWRAVQHFRTCSFQDLHRNFPTHELFGGEFEKIGELRTYIH